jgi:predicted dehydrogenase
MKFLIAGFGSIGRRHFRNLKALGQEDILFYRTGRSQLPEEELDGYIVEHDLDAALAHKPNAVIVANPTALHLEVAIPAAQAGCHLLLEKPISANLDKLEELSAAVQAGGSRVLVGFQFRYHPTLRKAVELLQSDALGKVVSARAHWGEYLPDWHPWEDYRQSYSARPDLGGGVVLTLSHPLDYLRWLFGDVSSLSAVVHNSGSLGIAVDDQAELILEFSRGVLGSLHLDYLQRPPAHWLEIICASGTLQWEATSGLLRVQQAGDDEQTHRPPDGFERNDLFLEQTRHFIEVVAGKAAPMCTLEDGVQALKLALAAHASSAEGRKQNISV